jgi:trehalose 6-phosphate phosphatase
MVQGNINKKSGTYIKAIIFDMDGVITQTAKLHALAWKTLFDELLQKRRLPPFSIDHDYPRYIDGIAREDGIRNFLQSRSLALPEGNPHDSPEVESIQGLAKKKNQIFHSLIQSHGVATYPDAIKQIHVAKQKGIKTAIISASKNGELILNAAGIATLFDAKVDGIDTIRYGIKGKPAPDVFLKAAQLLNIEPDQCMVVEDAPAGIEAAKKGNFAITVGIARNSNQTLLKNAGADIVLNHMDNLNITLNSQQKPEMNAKDLPSALNEWVKFQKQIQNKKIALFLDYDGTLTPIVPNPENAILSPQTRESIKRLSKLIPLAIVSGRDRMDVEKHVAINDLIFAGSHGFDIMGPGRKHMEHEGGTACLQAFDQAETELKKNYQNLKGVEVERKRFAIAVHYRHIDEERIPEFIAIFDQINQKYPQLKKAPGKKIIELKPNIDWHKGKSLLWLLNELNLNNPQVIPVYIGDDMTDEDAFREIKDNGIGILVGDHGEKTFARYALNDPDEVKIFLDKLIDTFS